MKQFLVVVALLVILSIATGFLFPNSEFYLFTVGKQLGMALFAFVWIPVFLFYAYDRKQSSKTEEDIEE